MSWYDRYKDEKILIHQGSKHNKFWAAHWDETANQVHVRWGRIGTKGQSQIKDFSDRWGATNFIERKYSEKRRKGYQNTLNDKEITQAAFDRLNTEAAIVGTQNKCENFKWVELTRASEALPHSIDFVEINEERLYDPACWPGILVVFVTKKEIDNRNRFTFLFTLEQTYDIQDANRAAANMLVETSHPLRKMVDKVEEAIGRSLQPA